VDAKGADLPFLKRDMDRAHNMFTSGLIAQNTRDDTDKNYQIAANKQESAEAILARLRRQSRELRRALEQQQAAVSEAEEKPAQCNDRFADRWAWCFRVTVK